jgi:hypothetical protein
MSFVDGREIRCCVGRIYFKFQLRTHIAHCNQLVVARQLLLVRVLKTQKRRVNLVEYSQVNSQRPHLQRCPHQRKQLLFFAQMPLHALVNTLEAFLNLKNKVRMREQKQNQNNTPTSGPG